MTDLATTCYNVKIMKLIFLDIDGVLNTHNDFFEASYYGHEHNKGNEILSRANLAVLDRLIDHTGAKIVVSSTWRFHFKNSQLHEMFKARGFKAPRTTFIGQTPDLRMGITSGPEYFRSKEIHAFLEDRDDVESYVILDDIPERWFSDEHQEHLIETDFYGGGLTPFKGERSADILGRTEEAQKKHDAQQVLLDAMIF